MAESALKADIESITDRCFNPRNKLCHMLHRLGAGCWHRLISAYTDASAPDIFFHCALQRSAAAEQELLALRQQRPRDDAGPPASLCSLLQELQACQQALEASNTTLATQSVQLQASGAKADELRGRLAFCEHERQAAMQEVAELRERLAAFEQARGQGENAQEASSLLVGSSERCSSSAEKLEGRAGREQGLDAAVQTDRPADAAVQTNRPADPAADLEAVFQERDVLRGQVRT